MERATPLFLIRLGFTSAGALLSGVLEFNAASPEALVLEEEVEGFSDLHGVRAKPGDSMDEEKEMKYEQEVAWQFCSGARGGQCYSGDPRAPFWREGDVERGCHVGFPARWFRCLPRRDCLETRLGLSLN